MAGSTTKLANFCIHNQRVGCRGGYNPELILRKLTEIESEMLSCIECKGILRNPIHVDDGYKCKDCLLRGEDGKLDEVKSKLIEKLESCCPFKLDGCGWEGTIAGFEGHAKECRIIGITCPFKNYGCNVVRKRKDMETHEGEFLIKHLKMMKERIEKIESEVRITGGIEWEIRSIEDVINRGEIHWSPCFYVGLYKFQVSFKSEYDNEPNYICILIHVCKGGFDESLEWPFNGKFNISILNKTDSCKSISYEFSTDDDMVDSFSRPLKEGCQGYGFPDFTSDEELLSESYSKDNFITLKVLVEHTPKWKLTI